MILLLQNIVETPTPSELKIFFYNPYIVSIFGSVLLSVIGVFLIWFLRPKVKIAPYIAKLTKDGKDTIMLKVINKSYLFQLIDINFELTMLKPVSTPKGMNIAIEHVGLVSKHLWFLSRRKFRKNSKGFATFAIVIRVDPEFDLIDAWKNNANNGTYFDLKVIAKNNFSGITSITHQKFDHSSCIKNGEFCHGNSFDIENGF